MLTVEKIKVRLAEIRSVADDDERAHIWEKDLWADTLRAIALHSDCPASRALAEEALKSQDIEFARWFA